MEPINGHIDAHEVIYEQSRIWTLKDNPNGIASHGPRVAVLGYLGTRYQVRPNPNGVAALATRMMNNQIWRRSVTASVGRNPLGVATNDRLMLARHYQPLKQQHAPSTSREVSSETRFARSAPHARASHAASDLLAGAPTRWPFPSSKQQEQSGSKHPKARQQKLKRGCAS